MAIIPFVGNPGQRLTGTGDQRYVNVLFDVIANDLVKDYEVHCVKRAGLANHSQPLGGAATGRGVFAWQKTGKIYSVFGTQLLADTTTIASLASSSGRVWFTETPETSSTQVAIVSDGLDSYYIGSNDAANQVDQSDTAGYPTPNLGPVFFFSNYIFMGKSRGSVLNSHLNDFATFSSSNDFSTGAKGDDLEAIWLMKDQLVALGKRSIEFTFDNGNPTGSPLLAVDQNRLAFGIASKNSLAWSGDLAMFVGEGEDGRSVWLLQAGSLKEVSNSVINRILMAEGTGISSCTAWMERVGGQLIYVLNLSTANRSFVYSVSNGLWCEWADTSGAKFNGAYATSLNGTVYVQDATNGRVYTLSASTFQDSGSNFTVTLQTPRLSYGNQNRKWQQYYCLVGDTSTGNATLTSSDDDFSSFGGTRVIDMSKPQKKLLKLGSFVNRSHRLTYTQNAAFRVQAFDTEVQPGVK